MTANEKHRTPRETIAAYVTACRIGGVETLRSLFAANALMWGFFYQGDYYLGSPQRFYDEIRDNPSPAETGIEYIGEISSVEQDGGWLIASKAYMDG